MQLTPTRPMPSPRSRPTSAPEFFAANPSATHCHVVLGKASDGVYHEVSVHPTPADAMVGMRAARGWVRVTICACRA